MAKCIDTPEGDDLTQVMIEQAVYQQLFCGKGSNRIMGKNPENTMQLTGVQPLLKKFMNDIRSHLPLIKEHKIAEFLGYFKAFMHVDLSSAQERIETNLAAMGGMDGEDTVLYYITLTKFLEEIREFSYGKYGFDRIKEIYAAKAGKKFNAEAKEKVHHLASLNEENISLLYNLSFISFLTISYNKRRFSQTMKRLITQRVNRIVAKVL